MPQVSLSINNRNYTVACGQGEEERVRKLAAFVDKKVKSMGIGAATESQLLVLGSLMLADEVMSLHEQLATNQIAAENKASQTPETDHIADQQRQALKAALNLLTDRIESVAETLEKA